MSDTDSTKRLLIGSGVGAVILAVILIPDLFDSKSVTFPLGLPLENFLLALFTALAAGLTAAALVLMYRTSRIINFSQIALGALAATLFYELYTRDILPYGAALAVAALGGLLIAVVVGLIAALLFFRHPRLVMTVVTILFGGLLAETTTRIASAFRKPGETTVQQVIEGPYRDASVTIGVVPFRTAHLVGIIALVAVTIGLVIFFRRTRVGTAIRASAENADRASLLGINVKALLVLVWAIVGTIASVSQLAVMPVQQYNSATPFDQSLLLLPLAAAVVARMSSMPVAFFAATGLELLQSAIVSRLNQPNAVKIGLFVVLVAGMLVQRKKFVTRREEATSWKAVKEPRPTPREMLALPSIARARQAIILTVGVLALVFPWIVGIGTVESFQAVWLTGIVAMSLVMLTGWSGQISLGQFAIVTIGAFVAGNLALNAGFPFLATLPVAGIAGTVFALLVGIPALRIRGLFLAVTTFAIAIVLPLFIFDNNFLGDFVPRQDITRPRLFFLDFNDQRSWYYLGLVFFLLFALSMRALRKSRAGRVLIAMRDNEDGVQAFGVDIVRTRLIAFGLSGFIAGVGGALVLYGSRGMGDVNLFSFGTSLNLFVLVVIGGVSSVFGAFLGAFYFVAAQILFPSFAQLTQGILGLMFLMFIPGGLTQVVFGFRDAILRVVAMRQHIIVPSLFADYSPEAWEKRLAPLAQPVQSQGLAALRHDQRYALPSYLYGKAQA